MRYLNKLDMILVPVFLFAFALSIRLSGGIWGAQPTNDEYMARQAEYIYTYGHPAVPDPYSASELYQPAMAYLLALVGHVFDIVPLKMEMSSMTISEGIVPPIVGALTVVVIYWLGTELYDRRAGIIASIFASVSYPLLVRGLKGYTFHNALSLLLIVLTAVIIIRAIDTLKKPFPKKTQQQLLYIVNLFLPAVLIGFTGFAWGGYFILHTILISFTLILSIYYLIRKRSMDGIKRVWIFTVITLILGTGLAYLLYPVKGLCEISRAMQMLSMQKAPLVYASTADLQPTRFTSYEMVFGPWVIIGVILLLTGMFALFKTDKMDKLNNIRGIYLLSLIIVTLIPAVKAYHFLDIFSMFAFVGIGIGAVYIFNRVDTIKQDRPRQFSKAIIIIIVSLMLYSMAVSSAHMIPHTKELWPENYSIAYKYIKNNTDEDALFFNWWDYGNSIGYTGNRRTVIDQMNIRDCDVIPVSKVIMGTDPEEGLKIVKEYKEKYNSSEVYLLITRNDAMLSSIIGYCAGYEMNNIFITFHDSKLKAMTPISASSIYYRLWNGDYIEGYELFYENADVKIFKLNCNEQNHR